MSFETIAKQYLSELQKEVNQARITGAFTPELSYRPRLDDFLRKIARLIDPEIELVFEPKLQAKAGRPDWRFHNSATFGIYGYAEAKGLNPNDTIAINTHQEQVDKYLRLGHNVILTDGIDFVFFDPKTSDPEQISLVNKPIFASTWGDLQPNPLLEARFRSFFQNEGFRRCSELQLIKEMALRAVELSKNIEELADCPSGSGLDASENETIEVLHKLKTILESHHDPILRTPKAFADFVAQVLVFGLLYAHRVMVGENDTPKDRDFKMQQYWSNTVNNEQSESLRPFRALIEMLGSELQSLSRLGVWYSDCRLLLAHIELEDSQRMNPDYHILYENFLSIFDPKTRFDYGAFYTPRELVEFAVLITQSVVEKEVPGKSLYGAGNKLIDPCCGTGTFLEQLLVYSKSQENQAIIIGFEILPAPYALAHYRLSMLENLTNEFQRSSIILTNTLCDELERDQEYAPQNLIDEEQFIARNLARPPLTLVIGNPPSSDTSPHTIGENFMIIEELLKDFRPPMDQRTTRQNTQKQLRNEFIKFLRWTCEKLLVSPIGIFTLVLPSSFAEHPSYQYARKWLVEHFCKLWVLDLDLDGRTGVRASSLFHTLQGRLLLVGLRQTESNINKAQVFYHSIASMTKLEKQNELTRERDMASYLSLFTPVPLNEDTYCFRPAKSFDVVMYSSFWQLHPVNNEPSEGEKYIFNRHNSGVKLGSSSLFIHADKRVLLRRCSEIANEKNSVADLKQRWFLGQDKPPADQKFSLPFRREMGRAIRLGEASIRPYAYRPLINLPALFLEPLLREFSKVSSGTRLRPEVLHAFQDEATIGIAIAPAPKDIGEKLHRFASFCWTMPDNDLCMRGDAHIFCNQFPEYWRKRNWDPKPFNNINPELLQRLDAVVSGISHEDVLYYVYGILCSDVFLDAFEGALYSVASAIPKIPFSANGELLKSIAVKGKQLADLEKPTIEIDLSKSNYLKKMEDLFIEPFNLVRYDIDEEAGYINLRDQNGQVAISIKPVAREVLEFAISGYQIIRQWLKVYSFRYTRMQFSKEQYIEMLRLLSKIELQISIVRELDFDIAKLLTGDIQLL
ncbi:MAG: type ISP restriction/modification enzyme [Ktedonobacteraceae bacterium]